MKPIGNVLAEIVNKINLSPPNNQMELNHQCLSETFLEMFFNQPGGLLLPGRQKENKKSAPSNLGVPPPGSGQYGDPPRCPGAPRPTASQQCLL